MLLFPTHVTCSAIGCGVLINNFLHSYSWGQQPYVGALVENMALVRAWPAHQSRFFTNRDPWRALVPVHEPRGPAGASWALVPVRLDPFVPVPGTNRDQCASLLAHIHWSRFQPRTGTNELPIYSPSSSSRALHTALFFAGRRGEGIWVL